MSRLNAMPDPGGSPVAGFGSIVERVLQFAVQQPDAPALVREERVYSYAWLGSAVARVAGELRRRAAGDGTRVLIVATSSPAFVVCYLAVHLARCIAVPVDAGAPKARIAEIRQRTGAGTVLESADQDALLAAAGTEPDANSGEPLAPWVAPESSAIADIMFTSGTTGTPKGVVLRHRNLVHAARHINGFVGTRAGDVELLALPLAHSFGLGSLRCLLSVGACAVLVDGFAFPALVFGAMERHGATGLRSVPAGLATLLRLSGDRLGDFANTLRYMELGSAPMPLEDKQRLMRLLPRTRLCMHYGLTEASRSVYIEFHESSARLDSVGRPATGVEVGIFDEDGARLPAGEQGEIRIRGPHVMEEHWRDARRTAQALHEGWLCTGDFGHVDADGYLYLAGRRSDLINVGGRKVSPLEVEDALRSHPDVHDCACSGIPDPAGIAGEAVAVLVHVNRPDGPGERELRRYLRERLEPYKVPARWTFSGEIPRTANGKVQRHLLRDLLTRSG